jgi:hypothetical protein
MNDISKKQSMEGNVKIAAAFRYAYKRAKLWKSLIWALTLALAVLQLLAAINHQNLTAYLPDNLAAMVVTVSLLSMLMSTLGKHYLVNRFVSIGSKLQRLHDFEVLGLGVKPTILEIRPSQVESMSKHWLDRTPADRPNLSEWWPNSVSELPENAGTTLCLLSTFKWEFELRQKYGLVLLLTGTVVITSSLLLMHILDYKLSDYIVNIFVPLSPLLALIIDEWLINSACTEIAKESSEQAHNLWREYSSGTASDQGDNSELNKLTYLWGNYRSAASPIFDWLYWITQKTMNKDMLIDAQALVSEYKGAD